MPRRGSRRLIAKNVYEDASGRAIIYRDHDGRQRERRYPPQTPIAVMRADVGTALAQSSASGIPKAATDTLAAAVDRWEPLERHLVSWKERRAELRAWVRAELNGVSLGDLRLHALTPAIVRAVLGQWATADRPVSAKTIRNRRWTLQHLFRVLYGPRVRTPVDDVPPPALERHVPTWIDPVHILAVYRTLLEQEQRGVLRDAKTRARFMVRAACGRRPAEIMRAQPGDVHLERREWRVRDAKGGWSEGLYLNDDMREAWRVFIEADAWGTFNTGSMAKVLRSAGWAPNGDAWTRPYELRHNVGIAASDAGVDLADIAGLLGHRDLRTTRRTYVPIRQARMQRTSDALNGRLGGWAVPATVPVDGVEKRGSTRRNTDPAVHASHERKRAISSRKTGH